MKRELLGISRVHANWLAPVPLAFTLLTFSAPR
jgi:hypothetical protein